MPGPDVAPGGQPGHRRSCGFLLTGLVKKALKTCGKVVELAGSNPDVESRRNVAEALRLKAPSLWALGRGDEVPAGVRRN